MDQEYFVSMTCLFNRGPGIMAWHSAVGTMKVDPSRYTREEAYKNIRQGIADSLGIQPEQAIVIQFSFEKNSLE